MKTLQDVGRLTKMAHYYRITEGRKAREMRPDEQRARLDGGGVGGRRGEATPTMRPGSKRPHASCFIEANGKSLNYKFQGQPDYKSIHIV